jgi:hypothetical protein
LFWSLGAGLLAIGAGTKPSVVAAQSSDYRSAAMAPVVWQQFSQQLQLRFVELLAADGKMLQQLQDYLVAQGTDAGALSLTLQGWISPAGNIERVELLDPPDAKVAAGLRALLSGGHVGVPPAEMPQPLKMRLSLRSPDQPGQGE